ncbi:DUF2812 domain-containing protein [Flavonifractor sp. HCP28S3_F3]|uniref:DUF2812 domain-containing protein n=1 Tax=Flavonifractor sp. HCP28S3_F3 TaxID=3438939 RepID=UPI003F88D4D2
MKDRIRKLIYIEPLDMDHFEGWLEEMARKGLLFERMSYWGVVFRRGKPADLRYRLEPAGRLWTRESKDYCRELGWDYLGQAGQYFELYANPDPEAPELHSDPVVQSYALDLLSKWLRWYLVLTLLLAAALFIVLTQQAEISIFPNLCLLVFDLVVLAQEIRTYVSFFRLRRQLREGMPPQRDGSWRVSMRWRKLPILVGLVVLLLEFGLLAALLLP